MMQDHFLQVNRPGKGLVVFKKVLKHIPGQPLAGVLTPYTNVSDKDLALEPDSACCHTWVLQKKKSPLSNTRHNTAISVSISFSSAKAVVSASCYWNKWALL